jgi:hypothetical protein
VGDGDLDETEAMVGMVAVLENAQAHGAGLDDFALGVVDDFDRHGRRSSYHYEK